MKKSLFILVALMLACAASAQAAGIALTDAEMDEIDAGFWVKYAPNSGEEAIEEVWHSTNDINLEDESQTEIQAVNNVNSVDSAVAVQSNIAAVTVGTEATISDVTQGNTATLSNSNPSIETATLNKSNTTTIATTLEGKSSLTDNYDLETWLDTTNRSLVETDLLTVDLDIIAAFAAAGESEEKGSDSEYAAAGAFGLIFDLVDDYKKTDTGSTSDDYDHLVMNTITDTWTKSTSDTSVTSTENGTYSRENLSENNHIDLKDDSQRLLQVVSNLNAVGSSAAVQTNIASNVGMSGTITQANVATAVNGL